MSRRTRSILFTVSGVAAAVMVIAIVVLLVSAGRPAAPSAAQGPTAGVPVSAAVDPGSSISGRAPNFTLTDQFGHRVTLSSFRGQTVILAFNDSQCTTVCPLTTTAMLDAKRSLGAAGSHVALLGVDANPRATRISDVRAYSRAHGMLHRWQFLTGSRAQLRRVWKAYGIAVEIQAGQIDHTPALFEIDPHGRLRKVYLTQMSYASVPALGQVLAREASDLLPGHPPVRAAAAPSTTAPLGPGSPISLPRSRSGTLRLGGRGSSRLLLFFDTWDAQDFPDLGRRLEALNAYAAHAGGSGGPPAPLAAIDERSVEPSSGALGRFLRRLPRRLSYPVALDASGRVADGYQVQDEPWLVLVHDGRIVWSYDVSTQGWLTPRALRSHVRAALAHPRPVPTAGPAATRALSASPGALIGLHRQASQVLGGSLGARLRALRGYPVVINAWASWCSPCQHEFPLFAAASVRYGRRVAFLGADTSDSAPAARTFLAGHRVSYPSYETTSAQLSPLAQIIGLPTTIFVDRAGRVVHVHSGPYQAQGTLDQDIAGYALGG